MNKMTTFLNKLLFCFSIILLINNHNTVCAQIGFKKLVTNAGVTNNGAKAIALQPDNKTITCGYVQKGSKYQIAFYRLNSNGIVDTHFGENGISLFYNFLPSPYEGASISSISLQDDGKFIAAGTAWYQSGSYFLSNILVMRLNSNGTIDSSFGDNGTVRTNIFSVNGLSIDDAYTVKVLKNGNILAGGTSYDYTQHRMLFSEYLPNGVLNTSFGSGGVVLIDIAHGDDEIFDMAVLPNGNIVAAGEYFTEGVDYSYDVALLRLLPNGILDKSFGSNGIVKTRIGKGADAAKSIALQKNGKIVIAGSTRVSTLAKDNILVARYNANGTVDSSFALNGIYIKDINGGNDVANSVEILPDNKIVLGGYATRNSVSNFLSLQLKNNGNADDTYGINGMVITSLYNQGDAANDMLIQPDGKIVQAGQAANGASNFFTSIRYNNDGSLDNSYANNGINIFSVGNSNDKAEKIIKLPWDNSLLLCGSANDNWALINYKLPDLSLNNSFGVKGIQSFRYADQYSSSTPEVAVDSALQKIYLCGETDKEGFIIIRLNKNGSLDTSFGDKGVVHYFISIYYGGLAVLPNHKIVIGGLIQSGTNYNFIACFNTNGTIDSSFGVNGLVKNLAFTPNSIINDNQHTRILLSGSLYVDFISSKIGVMALKNKGIIDSSFGKNGVGSAAVPGGGTKVYFKYNLVQDMYGKILVSGGVSVAGADFSVTRFLNNGQPDNTFGNGGVAVTTTASDPYNDTWNEGVASRCVNKNNCSVVTAGIRMNDQNEKSKIAIIAYDDNGNIDSIKNTTKGYIDTTLFGGAYEGGYAALFDNDAVYVAGKTGNKNENDFLLLKFIFKSKQPVKKQPQQSDYALKIFPNPAHNFLMVNYSLNKSSIVKFQLCSLNGAQTYQLSRQASLAGAQQVKILLPVNIAKGVYTLKMITKDAVNIKIVFIN
jgi:uncharacterized delta-60 repeat protein